MFSILFESLLDVENWNKIVCKLKEIEIIIGYRKVTNTKSCFAEGFFYKVIFLKLHHSKKCANTSSNWKTLSLLKPFQFIHGLSW